MTRREFIGMGSVGVVAVALTGRLAWLEIRARSDRQRYPIEHIGADWRARLDPASYKVLRQGATEEPFSSPLLHEHRSGTFACAGCGNALFHSTTKFDSHTGWPSFWEPLPNAVVTSDDHSLGRSRTEVRCADCGSHLGHVFEDGPKPTGLRYCMNGLALTFRPHSA